MFNSFENDEYSRIFDDFRGKKPHFCHETN